MWPAVRFALVVFVVFLQRDVSASVGDYTHEWAVRIDGGDEQALLIAQEQNYDIVDKVSHWYIIQNILFITLLSIFLDCWKTPIRDPMVANDNS